MSPLLFPPASLPPETSGGLKAPRGRGRKAATRQTGKDRGKESSAVVCRRRLKGLCSERSGAPYLRRLSLRNVDNKPKAPAPDPAGPWRRSPAPACERHGVPAQPGHAPLARLSRATSPWWGHPPAGSLPARRPRTWSCPASWQAITWERPGWPSLPREESSRQRSRSALLPASGAFPGASSSSLLSSACSDRSHLDLRPRGSCGARVLAFLRVARKEACSDSSASGRRPRVCDGPGERHLQGGR